VCAPELNTLRDVRECQRVFGEIIRLDTTKLTYVLNHYQPFTVLRREQFETALEQPMAFELPHAGDAAAKAAAKGEPLLAGHSGFARAIERLAISLAPDEVHPKPRSMRRQQVAGAAAGPKPRGLAFFFKRFRRAA
jgi:Flp pilus assembly CpaE family ATPase